MALVVVAPIAGRLADRCSAGLRGAVGMVGFSAGLIALAQLPSQPSDADIIWRMALCGMGFALFQSPNSRTIIGSAPKSRTSGASGMLGTARLLGQTTGAATVALIFNLAQAHGASLALALGLSAARRCGEQPKNQNADAACIVSRRHLRRYLTCAAAPVPAALSAP